MGVFLPPCPIPVLVALGSPCVFGDKVMYHGAAKIVKPKMDALKVAAAKLAKAHRGF